MAIGQITIVTAKGAGMTYSLKVESGGKRSDHGCDRKIAGMTYSLEVERGGQEVR